MQLIAFFQQRECCVAQSDLVQTVCLDRFPVA
jgi:hypothetical protein